jgi:hypothetical protein
VSGAAEVALHGPDAVCHDHHAQSGSFAAAIAHLRAHDRAIVTTTITRSNYRVLGAMPPLVHGLGAAAWRLRVASFGDFSDDEEAGRRVPRLGLALPFALHALQRAAQLGLAIAIVDAPRCLLGGHARALEVTAPRAFPAPCDGCAARDRCAGIDAAYAARFGADELTRQSAP